MTRRSGWSGLFLVAIATLLTLTLRAGAEDLPPALRDWRDWVLKGYEHVQCPHLLASAYGEKASHPCAWPGRLLLDVTARGARFETSYIAYAPTWVALPGDTDRWPAEVRVDGVPAPVVMHAGGPATEITPGRHRLDGRFEWQRRPEALALPGSIGLVDLILDGQRVFPVQRDGSSLWLGRPEALARAAEALAVQVYRKLSDGLPPLMETRLRLDVSGQAREQVLGPALPQGFVPTGVASALPVMLEPDGLLRVQLRPGNWQVALDARGVEPLTQASPPTAGASWPNEEIWSYEAAPWLRVTSASGGTPVDPSQVDVPAEWQQLPAFVLSANHRIAIEERSRGMAEDANRLSLSRQLWLDFDSSGMTARDTVTGNMVTGFRLDVAPPFELRRAEADGNPLLVTEGPEPGLTGIELRNPEVRLSATSRIADSPLAMPVAGWRTSLESVHMTLHLPPARELVAAIGADSSPQAWIDRFSLFDVFLLLVTSLVTARLIGRRWGLVTFAFLLLGYHESVGPLWCLLLLVGLSLIHQALPAGRLARLISGLRLVAVVVLALVVLPFVATQLRLALYPQLEGTGLAGSRGLLGAAGSAAPMSEQQVVQYEPEAPVPLDKGEGALFDQDAKVKQQPARRAGSAAQRLQRYATSNVFQAGGGEPSWQWRQASLSWSGPVAPDQTVRLVVTPAWLTRLLRVVLVGLLMAVLWRLLVVLRDRLMQGPSVTTVAAVLALGAAIGGSRVAVAQQFPGPELLDQLRQRLLAPPECVPHCAGIERATVQLDRGSVAVQMLVHVQARSGVPVPTSPATWRITGVVVDGRPGAELLRDTSGTMWLALERGVHRVDLDGSVGDAGTIELRFPLAPSRTTVGGSGWEATGLREGRLLTDTLTLVRVRGTEESPGSAAATLSVAPFVRVDRELDLDLDWTVGTTVTRVAPHDGSVTTEVPLLPGESLLTSGLEEHDGRVTVGLAADAGQVSWQSRLERVDSLSLVAPDLDDRSETWRVLVSPQWSARFSGLPATYPSQLQDFWLHEFHPLPGETLVVEISRPEAVAGPTLAIDSANLSTRVGRRASEHLLTLALRSTRGGQHAVTLPAEAEVLEVTVDGSAVNVRPEQGRLTIPVHPGEQRLEVRWRDSAGVSLWSATPPIDLGAKASNLGLELHLPAQRWVVATRGPAVGPAVLYWGELLVMLVIAFALARLGRTPLGLRQWLLLGLGFSTFSWPGLVVVVVWLYALDARGRLVNDLSWWRFDLIQLVLVGLTAAALVCVVVAIPFGLLGSPDMHVKGMASHAHDLRWFDDATAGQMPRAAALTLPITIYRLAMLAWSLWLASALVGWLRWGYGCLTAGGGWRHRVEHTASESGVERIPR